MMYTVDGMDNSLRPYVNAVRCTACSFLQQQFLAVLSINIDYLKGKNLPRSERAAAVSAKPPYLPTTEINATHYRCFSGQKVIAESY